MVTFVSHNPLCSRISHREGVGAMASPLQLCAGSRDELLQFCAGSRDGLLLTQRSTCFQEGPREQAGQRCGRYWDLCNSVGFNNWRSNVCI